MTRQVRSRCPPATAEARQRPCPILSCPCFRRAAASQMSMVVRARPCSSVWLFVSQKIVRKRQKVHVSGPFSPFPPVFAQFCLLSGNIRVHSRILVHLDLFPGEKSFAPTVPLRPAGRPQKNSYPFALIRGSKPNSCPFLPIFAPFSAKNQVYGLSSLVSSPSSAVGGHNSRIYRGFSHLGGHFPHYILNFSTPVWQGKSEVLQ
jgi:hypothetical protein